jgi:flagellar M-ring protein FliF
VAFLDLAGGLPRNVVDRIRPVLNANRRTAIAGGATVAAAVIVTAILWSSDASYSVLYAGLSGEEGGRTIAELQKLNIPFRITEGGRVILVPAADVGRARLQLASRGVPKQDGDHWALLDNESLGVSPFVEQVHYVRAVETALARTLRDVDGVVSATVKLALPKQTDFLADAPKPSAAVMIRLRPGVQLTTAQIDGLAGLVSASVPGLARESVTLVDQSGKVLNPSGKEVLQQVPQQLEIAREVARRYEAAITDLLVPVLGRGNFRTSADADIDFSQSKESLVRYGDSHVLSQDEAIHPRAPNGEQAIGIPGALSNRRPETPTVAAATQGRQQPAASPPASASATPPAPVAPDTPEPAPPGPPDSHRTTNYNIDRTVQYLEHPSWKLRALNIAVLINNPSGKPIPAERIQSVNTLVTSAIGIGENRHVTVVDLPFAEEGADAGEPTLPWWRQRWMTAVEQNSLLALAGLLVLFGGVFPLLRRINVTPASVIGQTSNVEIVASASGGLTRDAPSPELRVRHEPALSARSGSQDALGIEAETVRMLAANDTARTAQVIKEWIARDRRSIKHAG